MCSIWQLAYFSMTRKRNNNATHPAMATAERTATDLEMGLTRL